MNLSKTLKITLAATAMGASAAYADCGDVSIAEMNWATAEVMANIDAVILREGYGCDVELIPGATIPSFTSLNEKGRPQIAPELWANSVEVLMNNGISEGRMQIVNEGPFSSAGEGYFIPRWLQEENPELTTVEAVLERPDLFPHPDDESRGGFVTCPAGWGCEVNANNLFRAFDMESKGWDLVLPGSGAGLDGTIAKAGERNEPWFGYYWSPTTLMSRYDMVKLDWETDFDADGWKNCIVVEGCANPQPTAWTPSRVVSLATTDFTNANPELVDYLNNRNFSESDVAQFLAWKEDNQATGEDTAFEFLATNDVWKQWVPADVAAKIQEAL